jgi:hypothetical protein
VRIGRDGLVLPVFPATASEEAAHLAFLEKIRGKCGGPTLWERVLGVPGEATAAAEIPSALVASVQVAPAGPSTCAPSTSAVDAKKRSAVIDASQGLFDGGGEPSLAPA